MKRSHIALSVALLAVMVLAIVAPILSGTPVVRATTTLDSWNGDFVVYDDHSTGSTAAGIFTTDSQPSCDTATYVNLSLTTDYAEYRLNGGGQFRIDGETGLRVAWRGEHLKVEGILPNGSAEEIGDTGITGYQCRDDFTAGDTFGHYYIGFRLWAGAGVVSHVTIDVIMGTPTPTPWPSASPFPAQPTQCVTVTPTLQATAQRTPTPFNLTPGPTATRTPTPTPGGPVATSTPGASFDSGLSTFDQTIAPWTALITSSYNPPRYYIEWRSMAGADGRPGVVFTKDYWAIPLGTDEVISETSPFTGTLVYSKLSGLSFPLRLIGQARWSTSIYAGDTVYLSVWYLDPDFFGPGQSAWITRRSGAIPVSSVWGSFSYLITQQGGSGQITAVMVMEEVEENGPSYADGDGLLLDDLRLFSGPLAVAGSYPVCQGTGASGPKPVETKVCKIKQVSIDVYSNCSPPESVIDLIGWLSYWFCRVWRYFSFLQENRDQLVAIQDRQALAEPIGSLNELPEIFTIVQTAFTNVGETYNQADYHAVDWRALADWSFLDRKFEPAPAGSFPSQSVYLGSCPTVLANMSEATQKSACYIVYILRTKMPVLGLLQWALDIAAIAGFIFYVSEHWFAKNG